jgi:hypothetical protein
VRIFCKRCPLFVFQMRISWLKTLFSSKTLRPGMLHNIPGFISGRDHLRNEHSQGFRFSFTTSSNLAGMIMISKVIKNNEMQNKEIRNE